MKNTKDLRKRNILAKSLRNFRKGNMLRNIEMANTFINGLKSLNANNHTIEYIYCIA